MIFLKLLILLAFSSCATKYVIPGNRFLTPESQGRIFESQFEVQQATATIATIDLTDASVENDLKYSSTKKTGFLFSSSFLENLDAFWSHTGTANSIFGIKFQMIGGSRTSKSTGHKVAATIAVGGNEHELDGSTKIEFRLNANDYSLIHGYRFNEYVLLYEAISYSTYDFQGTITSRNAFNGLKPEFKTNVLGAFIGTELSQGPVFGKAEFGYQMLQSSFTEKKYAMVFGYSLGYSW